jgi:DNA-binding CsgD family transcriptional regulator
MPHLVRLARALGDVETARAAAAASQADSDADPMPVPVRQATARCCRAQVDEDVTGLLAAAEEYQANGWPAPQALALEEAAVLLAAAGDTARARSAFNSALRLYFRLGAAWDIRRTEARLRVYGVRRGSRTLSERATTGWAALTPSEQRVARLVARGLSNPDIALELFLSRRTVQTHVSNILVKLRVRSRIDVVRIAVGTTGLD